MKTQIIQIGNSQGIRIPKVLLEESRISGDVDLELHPEGILVRKGQRPRDGWADAFKAMAERDEADLEAVPTTAAEKKDWQW